MSRRQAAATAGVGGGLVYGGGVVRHRAVEQALKDVPKDEHPRVHALHMLKPVKGRKAWLVGTGLATVGAVPLGAGLVGVKRGGIGKAVHPLPMPGMSRARFRRVYGPFGGSRAVKTIPAHDLQALARTRPDRPELRASLKRSGQREPIEVVDAGPGPGIADGNHRAAELWGSGMDAQIELRNLRAEKWAHRRARETYGKADHTPLWREAASGTAQSLKDRGESLRTPVPAGVRATQLGIAAGSGTLGGRAVHLALRNRKVPGKAGLAALAGTVAATATIPATNRVVQRKHPEYVVTATGVKRQGKPIKRASSKTFSARPGAPRNLRVDVTKAEGYLGSRTPYRTQRAAITGAGGVPVAGPFVQAHTAGSFAPPGKRRETAVRQFAMGPAAGNAAGAAAAYGAAHLANRSARVGDAAERGLQRKRELTASARHRTGVDRLKSPGHDSHLGRAAAKVKTTSREATAPLRAHRLAKPFSTPKGAAAGSLAFLGARAVTGGVGGQVAITRSQNEQRAYNAKHSVGKAQALLADRKQARRKRNQANIGTAAGATSVAALAALGMRKERLANRIGIIGGAVGGSGALYGARVARGDAEVLERPRVAKSLVPGRGYKPAAELTALERRLVRVGKPHRRLGPEVAAPADQLPRYVGVKGLGRRRVIGYHSKDRFVVADDNGPNRIVHRSQVEYFKRDSVQITGSSHEHKALIRQYGDRGPLPAGLDRETKMKAYEARYVHAGGDKSEKWNHRANAAEGSRNAALATGTAGLAGLAALKHPRLARRMAKHPRLQHRLDATALTAGAAGGASELYGEYARHRRASYANSPGGVARSALTRMRSYTPDPVGKALVHLGVPKVPTAFRRPMPKALFHGTSHELKPGDVISPHNAIGGTDRGQGRAFATGDLRDAHSYARTRSGGAGGRVYRVEPVDHSDLNMENIGRRRRDGFTNVSSASGFRVVGEAGAPRTSAAPYKPKPVSRFRPQASAGISLGG